MSGERVSGHSARTEEEVHHKEQKMCSANGRRHQPPIHNSGTLLRLVLHLFLDSMGQTDINPTLLQLPQMWKKLNKNSAGEESFENLQNIRTTVKHFSVFVISVYTSI